MCECPSHQVILYALKFHQYEFVLMAAIMAQATFRFFVPSLSSRCRCAGAGGLGVALERLSNQRPRVVDFVAIGAYLASVGTDLLAYNSALDRHALSAASIGK